MKNDKIRSVYKGLILYPDDSTHVKAMQIINNNFRYKAILHDRDIDQNGEIKKAHFHYVIKLDSTQTNEWLSNTLEIKPNYIQKIISLKGALDYLTHKYTPDKFQYEEEELFGDLSLRTDENDDSDFYRLASLIVDYKIHTFKELLPLCEKEKLLTTLRKNSYFYTQMLKNL